MPFEFGYPLGAPNNPAFQKKVLLAALKLLEAPEGPILIDFPEEAPISTEEPVVLACPYVPRETDTIMTETERLCRVFKAEMLSLRPWYDMAVEKRKRTTVGLSQLDLDNICGFVCSFLSANIPENPRNDVSLAAELRFAADDLKAYYYEAMTAQPGMEAATAEALAKWFWQDTQASKMLRAVRDACLKNSDDSLQRVARGQLIPRRFL